MSGTLSPKASAALRLIDSGRCDTVTIRMIARLARDGLIDFDLRVNPVFGWYLTDKGREVTAW